MLQNTAKTLGFQEIMVYKTPPGGGGKPYLARGLIRAGAMKLGSYIHLEELSSTLCSVLRLDLLFTVH